MPTVKERRVGWAWDVVEGYPGVSPVHDVRQGSSPTQSSQPVVIHIRKESEAALEQVARHIRSDRWSLGATRGGVEGLVEVEGRDHGSVYEKKSSDIIFRSEDETFREDRRLMVSKSAEIKLCFYFQLISVAFCQNAVHPTPARALSYLHTRATDRVFLYENVYVTQQAGTQM